MPRWTGRVREEAGRAKFSLIRDDKVVGVIDISWTDYVQICRLSATVVLDESRAVIEAHLGTMIWKDAQDASHDSPDLAKQRLAELGWNEARVKRYAEELSLLVAQKLVEHLPENET